MKYWRGYVVAAIFAAISAALVAFAKAHSTLVDMVYPYMTRIVISSLADWSGGVSFCIWDALVTVGIALAAVSVILIIVLRWNPFQITGWALAVVMFFNMCSTLLYGLNDYTGPLAEDVRLDVTEYTVSELNDAAVYYRDQANKLAPEISRDNDGVARIADFEELALQAANGFEALTYDEAISIFAGSTAPVKKKNLVGAVSKTQPLTGECLVDPGTPELALPFVMCMEMAHRMSISDYEEAKYAAFLSCKANDSLEFRYSGYLMAYALCYDALSNIPTSTAQSCAETTKLGNNPLVNRDLRHSQDILDDLKGEKVHDYDVVDLLTSWYIQEFVTPLHQVEELPFDPLDPSQVDLTYKEPTPQKLDKKK